MRSGGHDRSPIDFSRTILYTSSMLFDLKSTMTVIQFGLALHETQAWAVRTKLPFNEHQIENMIASYVAIYSEVETAVKAFTIPMLRDVDNHDTTRIVDHARKVYDQRMATAGVRFPVGKNAYENIVGTFLIEFLTEKALHEEGKMGDAKAREEIHKLVGYGLYADVVEFDYLSGRIDETRAFGK